MSGKPHRKYRQYFIVLYLLILLPFMAQCAAPVSVSILDSRDADRELSTSVLNSNQLSAFTIQIMNRRGHVRTFKEDSAKAIAALHAQLITSREMNRDLLFALAETSYLHAVENEDCSYFLSAAIYAYAFLFPGNGAHTVDTDRFDPRHRVAIDIYNRGIARGFATDDRLHVNLGSGSFTLPFGILTVKFNPDELRWGRFRLVKFTQAAEMDVRGLRNKYRWPGIGAPLVASTKIMEDVNAPEFVLVPPGVRVPLTAFLRFAKIGEGLRSGKIESTLEVYTTDKATTVGIEGQIVPIEYGLSSALAYTLERSQMYELELSGFFRGDLNPLKTVARFRDGVFLVTPYRPGRIPLVLIHGTGSSPVRWGELVNEIDNDRELWGRYQVWLFTYNTGNPILYSAGILAEGLKNAVKELDPEGKDDALQKMVLVGHSQGGLLARLMATESGTRFWDLAFSVPYEQLDLSPGKKELLHRSIFFSPLPFVKRAVFIATPHGGSYIAGGWIGRLIGRFVSLPAQIIDLGKDLAMLPTVKGSTLFLLRDVPRSTDSMSPDSEFIKALNRMPVSPQVRINSIIAVKNHEDPRDEWYDGVVTYESAHIKDAESELIVHSGHSAQSEPATIEEIRRILILHMKEESS